jgi:predicted ABC-class ATPase
MIDKKEFIEIIEGIDGRSREEFAKLVGDFDFSRYVVKIGRLRPDGRSFPLSVRVPQIIAGFPEEIFETPIRRMALEDYLIRNLATAIEEISSFDEEGVAYRNIEIATPGQKILPRTSMLVSDEYIETHLAVRLPLRDELIDGEKLEDIFFEELQELVVSTLIYCNLDYDELSSFLDIMEDAGRIRQLLASQGLISFVGEGSLLKREPFTDDVDLFQAPLMIDEKLKTSIDVPNAGTVSGLGIKDGITLIIGDEYSGRCDLIAAISAGIYNHVPGDGREFVASMPDTVYISEEPGRSVQKVDISPFVISEDEGFAEFSSDAADGFESEAAALVENIEVGARILLFDESTSSPAFLAGDERIGGLISGGDPRTVPLAARARQLTEEIGAALVVAGNRNISAFIPVADTILLIEDYTVSDITEQAKALGIAEIKVEESTRGFQELADRKRWVVPSSIDPSLGKEDAHIVAYEKQLLEFGRNLIDLSVIEQLADSDQTRTIGQVLYYLKLRYLGESNSLNSLLDYVDRDLSTEGLACLSPEFRSDLARPRRYEIAAALNRLPSFRVATIKEMPR